ncbi:S8/S53 family peptidase [Flavobacterium sp.]|uniref:S8/S53 family peptidase n=1 Tax=Flavobacterium sp. TaxID=239 RepID=UPI0025C18F11|nr:S8/S53 family peptidase [Flavobacterium sp.]
MRSLESQYVFSLEKLQLLPDEKIEQMKIVSESNNENSDALIRIKNTYKVQTLNSSNAQLLELAAKLEALDAVSYCSLLSMNAIPPPSDIPPATPNYESAQNYIGPNPGVNMQFAWDSGLIGNGIRIRDVEYGFNKNHEEFNDLAGTFLQPGMTIGSDVTASYTEHGTAVFGVVFADKGTYGVSGMAYGAQEMVLFPEWQQSGYNRVLAVSQSIGASIAGDVIIYEMQAYGVNDAFVPAEYENLIWDLTKAATDSGIIIVAAAGNGNADLDSTPYLPYMNRGDSGAIIVGAGSPDVSHNKISYSTFGNRVNVQGWGSNVRSSGYGDFAAIFGDFNQRYTNFSGTSSATPIVASCAIVLQSYYHGQTGNYLTPAQMRNILVTTGIAQGSGGHIGPLPNMEPAIAAVTALATQKVDAISFFVYPNPANDVISIAGDILTESRIEVMNAVGQTVYVGFATDKNISVSNLTSGIYFVKVTESDRSAVRKIVKH